MSFIGGWVLILLGLLMVVGGALGVVAESLAHCCHPNKNPWDV